MSETLSYFYNSPSKLHNNSNQNELFLSVYNEVQKGNNDCFFHGSLTDPYLTARCLISLSQVVQTNFNVAGAIRQRDPIVTSGYNKIRFEGFSQCAGVYSRLDILPEGINGEFIDYGTTNVDFNPPMIAALSRIQRNASLMLSVGRKELRVQHTDDNIIEKKVSLPVKWLKALTSLQLFLSRSELISTLNRTQAFQLFQLLPPGKPNNDYHFSIRNNKPALSALPVAQSICIGGIYRLKVLEPLIAFADQLLIYSTPDRLATTFQLNFGKLRFSLTISRDAWRGFSGEGAALESLIQTVPDEWLESFDKFSYANQEFNPALVAIDENLSFNNIDDLTARLSAIGLLGFDLNDNNFFYRRLPFKLSRLITLHPRLKNADKLLAEGKVTIECNDGHRVEAVVAGSGVNHIILLEGEKEHCTCTWFSKHQGDRGVCKHILAVKKKIQK